MTTPIDDRDHNDHHTVSIDLVETDSNSIAVNLHIHWCVDDRTIIEYKIEEAS